MSPLHYYESQCQLGAYTSDPEQIRVLGSLSGIHNDLVSEYNKRYRFYSFLRTPRQVKGAYIWGGVGIGKTYMMDIFYRCLPMDKKLRLHFHDFMRIVHQRLKALQGKKNPLDIVANEIGQSAMVLCLDELLVTDITDAMILAKLFRALSVSGVCLVITSNMKPDDLYWRGLQRDLFLPAIELLKHSTNEINVPTKQDYRERHLGDPAFHETASTELKLEQAFLKLAKGKIHQRDFIEIQNRKIRVKMRAENIVWLDFEEICRVPRSQHDYLEIASKYKTVLVSHVRLITPEEKNTISLFVRMIDVFYDAGIQFAYTSEKVLDEIYTAGHMVFDFARTRSRLIEMQRLASEYFARIKKSLA